MELLDKETLIGKFLSGNASEEEKKQVTTWIEEDATNQKEFDELKKIWDASINLKKETGADVNLAWEEFKTLADSQPALTKFRLSPLKIAAVIAFFICTFFLVKFFITDTQNPDDTIVVDKSPKEQVKPLDADTSYEEVPDTAATTLQPIKDPAKSRAKSRVKMITVVAKDSAVVFLLSDNSKVYLNVNSKITYPEKFVSNERKVTLEGEAYFEVEHNSERPFIVLCQNSITRVVGTSFNVKGYDKVKEVVVTVLTGLVEVSGNIGSATAKILLAAGDMGTFYPEKNSLLKSKNLKKDKDLKWWKKGFLKNKIKNMFRKLKKKKK